MRNLECFSKCVKSPVCNGKIAHHMMPYYKKFLDYIIFCRIKVPLNLMQSRQSPIWKLRASASHFLYRQWELIFLAGTTNSYKDFLTCTANQYFKTFLMLPTFHFGSSTSAHFVFSFGSFLKMLQHSWMSHRSKNGVLKGNMATF